jgi:hypothetical protein
MQIELMATYFALRNWKENPSATRMQIGVWSHWMEDKPENHLPLPLDEVDRLKRFYAKWASTSFREMFPDDPAGAGIQAPVGDDGTDHLSK